MCAKDSCCCPAEGGALSGMAGRALLAVAGLAVLMAVAAVAARIITAVLPLVLMSCGAVVAALCGLLVLKVRQHGGVWVAQFAEQPSAAQTQARQVRSLPARPVLAIAPRTVIPGHVVRTVTEAARGACCGGGIFCGCGTGCQCACSDCRCSKALEVPAGSPLRTWQK